MSVANTLNKYVPHILNPLNYTKNPLTVTKDAYAPSVRTAGMTMEKLKNKTKSALDSGFATVRDSLSLSDEAKRELQNRGAKGIKAHPGF